MTGWTDSHTHTHTCSLIYKDIYVITSLLFPLCRSHTGYLSQFVSHAVPQPDNAEYLLQKSGVTVEACMAGESSDNIFLLSGNQLSKSFGSDTSLKVINLIPNSYFCCLYKTNHSTINFFSM